jgi:hypothetical protein
MVPADDIVPFGYVNRWVWLNLMPVTSEVRCAWLA